MTTKKHKVKPLGSEPNAFELLNFFLAECQYQSTGNGSMHMSITVPRKLALELSSTAKRRAALVHAYHNYRKEKRENHIRKQLERDEVSKDEL